MCTVGTHTAQYALVVTIRSFEPNFPIPLFVDPSEWIVTFSQSTSLSI